MEWPEDVVRLGHPTLNAGVGKCEWVRTNAGQTSAEKAGFSLEGNEMPGKDF